MGITKITYTTYIPLSAKLLGKTIREIKEETEEKFPHFWEYCTVCSCESCDYPGCNKPTDQNVKLKPLHDLHIATPDKEEVGEKVFKKIHYELNEFREKFGLF